MRLKLTGPAKRGNLAIIALLSLALAVLENVNLHAQVESRSANNSAVTINSNPPGAVIFMNGEYRFWGRTPFVLPYTLYGKYRIQANRRGYEAVNTVYNFTGESKGALSLNLTRKTAGKALYRSVIFPGWGQYYSERKFVGAAFMSITAGAFITLAINENQYQKAQNRYETALTLGNNSDIQNALQSLKSAQDSRNLTAYTVAGLWVFNALECLVFFPNFSDLEFFEKVSPKFSRAESGVRFSVRVPLD